MAEYTESIRKLIDCFKSIPGIGPKTAERYALHLVKADAQEAAAFQEAIEGVRQTVKTCAVCGNVGEADPCSICQDVRRDQGLICVVEDIRDLNRIETSGHYIGLYHVLHGRLSPADGVAEENLNLRSFRTRLKSGVREVVVATNPTLEGDATAALIKDLATEAGVQGTRLARGVPVGLNIEYANKAVLADAISGRLAF